MLCKKWIKIFATTILFFGLNSRLKIHAQTNETNFFTAANFPLQEKIFAATDKNFYLAGEIVWFKLYNVSADSLKPLDVSKVAYVEILNAQQKPVLQTTVPLNNGDGNGSFYLPSSVNSGNYIFRAYTNWMKNFGADNYFQKIITVVNTLTPLSKSNGQDSGSYKISFSPEGGNLIANVQNKIGFKVTDKNGNGVNCNGNVVDENNITVASFTALKFGLGSFYFTPSENHTYTAAININGKLLKQQLPTVSVEGYAMHVANDASQYTISVTAAANIQQQVYLSINSNNTKKVLTQTTDANGKATFVISKNQLAAGITHLTIFNNDKQPLCERLIFIEPQTFRLTAETDNKVYTTRSPVNVNIATTSNTNLSVAVYMIDSLQTLNTNSTLIYSSLTSALKENVESPEYYFTNAGAEEDSLLDDLLITEGILNFKVQGAQNALSAFHFAPEYEGHMIEGKVYDKNSGAPAAHIRAYLSVPGIHFKFTSAVSNDTGAVFFDVKDAYGSGELVVQTARADSMYRVEITDPFSSDASSLVVPSFTLDESALHQLSQRNLAMQVQNAYDINQLNTFNSPAVDTTPFYGFADNIYYLDNYVRFNTMEEVLREYITGLDVRIHQGNNYSLYALDNNHSRLFDDNPLVLVDGVPIFDMNKVVAYNPLKIKKAEVVKRKYFLNSFTADGILSYATYKGDLDGFPFEPATVELSYDGLQLQRKFYAPQYTTAEKKQSRLPDYRTTLYWSPQVTGSDKQISFYTSDIKGKYIAVVQGIDENGNTAYNTTEFEVK